MYYFNETIGNWADWGRIFQSRTAFGPLAKAICQREGLPFEPFLNCTPGTNAVFETGGRIIKIFAPLESGLDTLADYQSEHFGMQRAEGLGLYVPKILAAGEMKDRYLFRYLIMEKLTGQSFAQRRKQLDSRQKQETGRQLRQITERMNTPCVPWGETADIRERALNGRRWAPFSESFNRERRAFTKTLSLDSPVYVHGDLNEDNLLVDEDGRIAVIDFADAVIAPAFYEQALIASELFQFERPFLTGYFGDCQPEELAELCLKGLLLHDFGGDILRMRLGEIGTLHSLAGLKQRLCRRFSEG